MKRRACRLALTALNGVAALSFLTPQAAFSSPEFQCPGTRYIYTSDIAVPDPANTATTCITAYDGGRVANDGTFSTATPFLLGSAIWTAITNVFGQLQQIINPAGTTWNLGPLPGRSDSIGSTPALQTRYTYDSMRRVESTMAPVSPMTVTTSYTYNPTYTNQVNTTDRNGTVTTYSYNTLADPGRPATATETPGGQTITYTYQATATGRPDTVMETPGGRTLTYTYNDALPDRTVTVTDTTGPTTTQYTYDSSNRVTEVDRNGSITIYTYNPAGDLVQITDLAPNPDRITTYQYNVQGHVTESKDDMGTASTLDDRYICYQYDPVGRLTQYTLDTQSTCNSGVGLTTTFAYDARGQLAGITDPQGAQAQLTYVPAPGSLALLGLGLCAFAVRRSFARP